MTDSHDRLPPLQEYCCSGGYSTCAQVVTEAHVAVVGRGSVPSSSLRGASHKSTSRNMDHGQVGRAGRQASSMFSFHCWSDSHVSIPPAIPVVTGASEGIGRGYALEVSMTSLCVAVSSVTHMI